MDDFARVDDAVRHETQVVSDDYKRNVDFRVAAPEVAVKHVQKLAVNVMKVFAHDNTVRLRASGNDVNKLRINFVPQKLRVAAQHGHINFKMNVAHFYVNGGVVVCDEHAFFVLQFGWTVLFERDERLRVLTNTGWTVKYGIWHSGWRVLVVQSGEVWMKVVLFSRL